MKQIKLTSVKRKILASVFTVLTIVIICLAINVNAEITEAKQITDEKSLVRTTASLSRASNENNIVDIDTLTALLNKYAGSGAVSVSEKTSDILLVSFLGTSREYEVDISSGKLYEEIYTITYDGNGGTGVPAAQEKYNGEDIILSTTVPTKTGHEFVGWNTNAGATTAEYLPGATFSLDAETTLYAIWDADTYTVAYDVNGGSRAPANQTKTHNEDLVLSSTEPERTGYSFLGWGTSSTSSTAEYQPGDTYTANANITLYAIWDADKYTIKYNANGGSGAPQSQTKSHDADLTLSTTEPTWYGHEFLGWNTNSAATTSEFDAGTTFTTNADTTLYAIWEANTYTVKYDANGGSGAPSNQTKTHGVDLTLSSTKPTRTNYTFVGWTTTSTSTTAAYTAGGLFTIDSETTLYALWAKTVTTFGYTGGIQTFTVPATGTYKLEVYGAQGGGSGGKGGYSSGKVSLTGGTTLYIGVGGSPSSTSGGYNGGGASGGASYGGASYGGGGATHIAKATGVLSSLSSNKSSVLIVAGGGGGSATSDQDGYQYTGGGGSGGGTNGSSGSTGGNGSGSGGTGGSQSSGYSFGAGGSGSESSTTTSVDSGGTQTKYGHAGGGGGGYYGGTGGTSKGGSGTNGGHVAGGAGGSGYISGLTDGSTTSGQRSGNGTATITFVSADFVTTYRISYNQNGGMGSYSSILKKEGVNVTLGASNTFTAPSGKHFVRWNTKADGTGTSYEAGATYSSDADLTLYAIWTSHTSSCYRTCGGTVITPFGTHYVHDCQSCGYSWAADYLAGQTSTVGAACTEHGPCSKQLLICGGSE